MDIFPVHTTDVCQENNETKASEIYQPAQLTAKINKVYILTPG